MTDQEQELYMKYVARHILTNQIQLLKEDQQLASSSFVYLDHKMLHEIITLLTLSLQRNNHSSQTTHERKEELADVVEHYEKIMDSLKEEYNQINSQLEKLIAK
ncbi:hypothetical protein [Halalkalibacter sp. APA_J-10(15)]|uniref:hypothetical protein n=1 Tax=unclassified Halalkalibacter TaxID=2893063 RepID=UPI001FF3ADD7|nr:hypothetical protein [Halalkalibacter sp. APA_J-10(15)]MCK0471926.1 hypothetical protein [Halalkalibacter sp. APA_J-10(15)]